MNQFMADGWLGKSLKEKSMRTMKMKKISIKSMFRRHINEFDELVGKHRLKQLCQDLEKREDQMIDNMMSITEELIYFKKYGLPRCPLCKVNYKRINKESSKFHSVWEPACECSSKKLRLSVG